MRSGIIGFILGAVLVVLALILLQQRVIRDVEGDLSFRFDRYVFHGPEFPQGDFEQGRLVHRSLFPSRFTTTFYDAQYHEVTRADKPGRYGAVVRMELNGNESHQFITLYRTPARIFWCDTPWSFSVPLPPEIGLNPAVLRGQEPEIGEVLKYSFVGNGNASPNLAILLAGLSETPPGDSPAVKRTNVFARDANWWYALRERIGLAPHYPYLVDLPRDYNADTGKRWPLILYLLTAAERGTDLQSVRRSALPREIEKGRQVPAIVIAPQCADYEEWSPKALSKLLDEVCVKYRLDSDRIYVTGESETWDMATAYPERFAAIIPICGESDRADAARLKDLPVWAFYGEEQEVSSLTQTTGMIDGIRKAGGRAHVTISDGHHDSWNQAYATDALYTWLFAQKRGQPEVVTPGAPTP